MSVVTILTKIPWGKIVQYGPVILDMADRLLDTVKKHFGGRVSPPPSGEAPIESLSNRVAQLESNEVEQAELVSKMADQLGSITTAMEVISKRVVLSLVLSSLALLVSIIIVITCYSR